MDISPGTIEAIAFVISVLVGYLGPRPIEYLVNLFSLTGPWAVLLVYAVSAVVGVLGLLISSQFFEIPFTWDNSLTIVGLIFAAATFAYHRLKDGGKI